MIFPDWLEQEETVVEPARIIVQGIVVTVVETILEVLLEDD